MAGQTLQKIEQGSLSEILAQINHNFGLLQNSPFFKGIPGEPGEPGGQGIKGDRGTKIFCAEFTAFRDLFPSELRNQPITAVNAEWINNMIEADGDVSTTNFDLVCEALGIASDDSLMHDDMIIFQSDMRLFRYNQDTKKLEDTGIKFVTNDDARNTIQTLVNTAMQNYINSLVQDKIYLKQYYTIASKDGVNAATDINTATSYFPYKEGQLLPQRLNVTDIRQGQETLIPDIKRHKHFCLDDDATNLAEGRNTSPYGLTCIVGPLRNYIKTLKNGTRQNEIGNIVNPTYDKMPCMILMQNNYKSGLLIGHRDARRMSDYAMIYRNADGQLVLRREHRWSSSSQSEPVTELVIGSSEFLFNGNLRIETGYGIVSDAIDSFSQRNVLRLGNGQGGKINFKASTYNWFGIPANSILELDSNNDLLTSNTHSIEDDVVSYGRERLYIRGQEHQRIKDEFVDLYDANSFKYKIPSKKVLALMYQGIRNELDNIWTKDDFYDVDENIIPSLSLYQAFAVGTVSQTTRREISTQTNINLNSTVITKDYRPFRINIDSNHEYDEIKIGVYYEHRRQQSGVGRNNPTTVQVPSMLNMEIDWNKIIISKLPQYTIFSINEDQELVGDLQFANPAETFEDDVINDVFSLIDTSEYDNRTSFDKFLESTWFDSTQTERPGYSSLNHPETETINDSDSEIGSSSMRGRARTVVKHGSRILTGRHFKLIMKLFGEIVHWTKNNFVRLDDFNKLKEQDIVPEGAVIAWNPCITNTTRLQSSTLLSTTETLRDVQEIQSSVSRISLDDNRSSVVVDTSSPTQSTKIISGATAPRESATTYVETQAVKTARSKLERGKFTISDARTLLTSGEMTKELAADIIRAGVFSDAINTLQANSGIVNLATSVMGMNVDFKIPYGWIPCIGASLYEVSDCGVRDIGTVHKIYRSPDLRDKCIIGFEWGTISTINSDRMIANCNYQPDTTTISHKTSIDTTPSVSVRDLVSFSRMTTAPSMMSTTTGSEKKLVQRIKLGEQGRNPRYTAGYYPNFEADQNEVSDLSDTGLEGSANKLNFMVPCVRLGYIMKAPKPASGHAMYLMVSRNRYIRIYPTPADGSLDLSRYPIVINVDMTSGTSRNSDVVVIDELDENEIANNRIIVGLDREIMNEVAEDTRFDVNGGVISGVDINNMTERDRNDFIDILSRSGVDEGTRKQVEDAMTLSDMMQTITDSGNLSGQTGKVNTESVKRASGTSVENPASTTEKLENQSSARGSSVNPVNGSGIGKMTRK